MSLSYHDISDVLIDLLKKKKECKIVCRNISQFTCRHIMTTPPLAAEQS